jgi:hypothetical protein
VHRNKTFDLIMARKLYLQSLMTASGLTALLRAMFRIEKTK